jgi:hypothetical protein
MDQPALDSGDAIQSSKPTRWSDQRGQGSSPLRAASSQLQREPRRHSRRPQQQPGATARLCALPRPRCASLHSPPVRSSGFAAVPLTPSARQLQGRPRSERACPRRPVLYWRRQRPFALRRLRAPPSSLRRSQRRWPCRARRPAQTCAWAVCNRQHAAGSGQHGMQRASQGCDGHPQRAAATPLSPPPAVVWAALHRTAAGPSVLCHKRAKPESGRGCPGAG